MLSATVLWYGQTYIRWRSINLFEKKKTANEIRIRPTMNAVLTSMTILNE